MKKIILFVFLSLLIFFSICLYVLGFKIPQKDTHKDWPLFPETTHSGFKTTSYDSMHIISAFKIPKQPYMFIHYYTENIDPVQIYEHPELLGNSDKIGVFDINLNPVYFKSFSNTSNNKKSYLFTNKNDIYDLIIDKKDSLKSELYYSSISSDISYHKKAFSFIQDIDNTFLNNHGKDLILEHPFNSNYGDYYVLLIDKTTDEVYAYKQLKNEDNITSKYSSIQSGKNFVEEKYPKFQLIDSVFSKNHLTTKPLSFTPKINSYYTYYYNLTIKHKITYFKFEALDSDFINRNFTPILASQKEYLFLQNNLGYPGDKILFSISTD